METYGELLSELLKKRGIKDKTEAEIFLHPDYKRDLHDPYLMRDMERACVRLFEAIDAGQKTVIYADYDCDGIPGAVILQDLFRLVGYKNFEVYIPERNSEGYGLNMSAIKDFVSSGVNLIVTVDLGITAAEETAEAESHGIDVIITDHHLPPDNLPKAFAILNPKVDDYPDKTLAGAGVVFKFIQGFVKKYGEYFKLKEGVEKWMLDMAGLATIADMVPLLQENRAIAYFGLKVLRRSPRPGLQKLLAKMNIKQKHLTEDDLSFMVIPRLNAASRMGDPRKAFELLSTGDEARAGALSDYLIELNDERKIIVATIMREINRKLEKDAERREKNVIVIGNPGWRVGILGLVAGKLSDLQKKPVFVWGRDENNIIKGSCRSDGSVSVVELMGEIKDFFSEWGGHELAGGFTVLDDKIHLLEDALSSAYEKVKRSFSAEESGEADMIKNLGAVSIETWKEIEKLAPFGLGNDKPSFLFSGVRVEKLRKFGKNGSGEHLEITFSDGNHKRKGISFFSSTESFKVPLEENKKVNLLANFDLSRFRGREELRLRILDIL